jgi:hypothetical protein
MYKKLFTAILVSSLFFTPVSFGDTTTDGASTTSGTEDSSFDYKNTLNIFSDGVQDQSTTDSSEGIELTTFQDDQGDDGVSGILGAISTFLSFFKLIVAPIAVLFMIVMGVRMVAAGADNEEVLTQSKNYMQYALMGLIIIFMSDTIVTVFFGAEGEVFRGGDAGAIEFGRRSASLFEGIYSLIQVVLSAVAVFFLVTAGFRYVAGSYSDDQIGKAKKQITWALVGLFVVGVSEFAAKSIIFVDQGSSLGVANAEQLFGQVTNFIAGTLGTVSFAFLLYAGYLYISGSANEDNVAKAKKIIVGAFIGLILAGAAFALTNTIVELDASR